MPINSVITFGDSTVEVSNKNCQVMPPQTGKLINATVNGKAIVHPWKSQKFLMGKFRQTSRYLGFPEGMLNFS